MFDFAMYEQRGRLFEYEEELLSEDPLRIRITIPLEEDEPSLTYDDQRDVVELRR